MGVAVSVLEQDGLIGELIRAVRQGIYFGVETRIPFALTGLVRPYLFGKQARPLLSSIQFFADQTLRHGWVIARISVCFKLVERLLMRISGATRASEWHSFVAGCTAGYVFMVRDAADASLKRQINMAIGIRTVYSLCSYFVRHGLTSPVIQHTELGYARGQTIWYTLMWGVVMWHWRHQTTVAPGEMDKGQVNQMDFIYNQGDAPGLEKWTTNRYLSWLGAVLFVKYLLPQLPGISNAATGARTAVAMRMRGPAFATNGCRSSNSSVT